MAAVPRITGGGIPELDDDAERVYSWRRMVVHA